MDLCFSDNCNKGVNNARDSLGWTPLHQAAKKNNVDLAKRLIENSANVDSASNSGRTALQVAARENSVAVAKVLIENSANVDSANKWGQTALHSAAIYNRVDVAKILIENSANVDSTDKWGQTALHEAAAWNSVNVARVLIAHSADLTATVVSGRYRGLTPLQVAKKRGNQEMVELLKNALKHLLLQLLLQGTNNYGTTALHYAAAWNSVGVAKVLIENSVNVDSTDKYGLTALHYAALRNSVDVAKLLLANSANLNATAGRLGFGRGRTPLQVAEKKGHQEMVELLRNASQEQ